MTSLMAALRRLRAGGLIALALVVPIGGARSAAAQCATEDDLAKVEKSVGAAFACARHRLTSSTTTCTDLPPPPCAGDVVDDLVALADPPNVEFNADDRVALSGELRCQRQIIQAVARYTRKRLRAARAHQRGGAAEIGAARSLHSVAVRCAVAVGVTAMGTHVPAVGPACAAIVPPSGDVPASALAGCIDGALRARLERVLRPSLKPNIVLILTDDQPAWMMDPLETVRTRIAAGGVDLVEAAAQVPLCGPSRATILTGQYAYHHHVTRNLPPDDDTALDETSTIGTWLQAAGYRTGFFGKYVNGYEAFAPYVPPGWTTWQAFETPSYYGYTLVDETGAETHHGLAPGDYSTDVLAAKATAFIRDAGDDPFFVVFSPFGPHGPAQPAPRHTGVFSGVPPWRPPSYDEADVSDKPTWVRNLPPLTPDDRMTIDLEHQAMLETLLSVDEAVAAILDTLRDTNQEAETFVVFTSDNGLELGEHRWQTKGDPYQGSYRVPMIVRYPRLGPLPATDASFVSNVDLAATFAELAGVAPGLAVDGTSLLGLLDGTGVQSWRQDMLVEGWPLVPPQHMVMRSGRWKYVEYRGAFFNPGEVELYDLQADPDELASVHLDPANASVRTALATRLRQLNTAWTQPIPP